MEKIEEIANRFQTKVPPPTLISVPALIPAAKTRSRIGNLTASFTANKSTAKSASAPVLVPSH
jgi:hypothetical protein